MPDTEEVLDQSTTTEQDNVETAEQNDTESTTDATEDVKEQDNQQGDQTTPDAKKDDFIGQVPKELEPFKQDILKKYMSKTRDLAEERRSVDTFKKDAETLQQLMAYKPFQDWYNSQKNGPSATNATPTLTEEELDAIRTDPTKFDSFMTKKLESLVESKYGSQIKSFADKAEDIEVAKEYEAVESKFGDEFKLAHESGELDSYYDKGLDYKTAYASWKLDNGNFVSTGEVDKVAGTKAVQMVNKSKLSSTEKPSSGGGKLPNIKVIKGKQNFSDTFDAFMEAAMKGEKVKFDKN